MSRHPLVVVDTDAASALLFGTARRDPFARALASAEMVFPFSVAGELLAYAVRAGIGDRRGLRIREALRRSIVLRATDDVVDVYALLHSKLTGHLRRGGMNDMWTAACAATQHPPLPVLTGDRRDFVPIASVIGLELVDVA